MERAESAQAKVSSLSVSTTVTSNPSTFPVALKCSLAAHFLWLSSDDESDVWGPDSKLHMKFGTLSVLVKQHSKGRLADSRSMLDLSDVGQDAVANSKFLSYRLKVNEVACLTTSDFVSQYSGYKPNKLWSGLEHLGTHGYIDQSLVDTMD